VTGIAWGHWATKYAYTVKGLFAVGGTLESGLGSVTVYMLHPQLSISNSSAFVFKDKNNSCVATAGFLSILHGEGSVSIDRIM
jgi:hypothetical protein